MLSSGRSRYLLVKFMCFNHSKGILAIARGLPVRIKHTLNLGKSKRQQILMCKLSDYY
jgi:hypothetical protein